MRAFAYDVHEYFLFELSKLETHRKFHDIFSGKFTTTIQFLPTSSPQPKTLNAPKVVRGMPMGRTQTSLRTMIQTMTGSKESK